MLFQRDNKKKISSGEKRLSSVLGDFFSTRNNNISLSLSFQFQPLVSEKTYISRELGESLRNQVPRGGFSFQTQGGGGEVLSPRAGLTTIGVADYCNRLTGGWRTPGATKLGSRYPNNKTNNKAKRERKLRGHKVGEERKEHRESGRAGERGREVEARVISLSGYNCVYRACVSRFISSSHSHFSESC